MDLLALMAGNDILLISNDIPLGIEKIKIAYQKFNIVKTRGGIRQKNTQSKNTR